MLNMQWQRRHSRNSLPIGRHHRSRPDQRWRLPKPSAQGIPSEQAKQFPGHIPVHCGRGCQHLKVPPSTEEQALLHKPLNCTVDIDHEGLLLVVDASLLFDCPLGCKKLWSSCVRIDLIHHNGTESPMEVPNDIVIPLQHATQLVRRPYDDVGIHACLCGRDIAIYAQDCIPLALREEAHRVNRREELHCQLSLRGNHHYLVTIEAPCRLLGHGCQQREQHGQRLATPCLALDAQALTSVNTVEDRLLNGRGFADSL
mmetsp:Transcript_62143/g.148221  ORF Transcript_62143/g.148221 Transcript_62143/m.148221 type:complete len:257 (+) Transcript_62143:1260-2030(+)